MDEMIALFIPIFFVFGLIIGWPTIGKMNSEGLELVSTQCSNNKGLKEFSPKGGKIYCNDGAVFTVKDMLGNRNDK